MERGSSKSESLFTSAQSAEVLGCLGDDITTEFHNDATGGLSTDGNVEVNFRKRPALEKEKARESVQGQIDERYTQSKERSLLFLNSTQNSIKVRFDPSRPE